MTRFVLIPETFVLIFVTLVLILLTRVVNVATVPALVFTVLLNVRTAPVFEIFVMSCPSPTNFPYTVPVEIVEKNP